MSIQLDLFIFCVKEVSGHWRTNPVPLGESFNFKASSVPGNSGVDVPGLLVDNEDIAMWAWNTMTIIPSTHQENYSSRLPKL